MKCSSIPRSGLIFLITAVLLLVPLGERALAASSDPLAEQIAVSTPHGFDVLWNRVQQAVRDNKMGIVGQASASRGAASRGITIPGNAVVMVYRNDFAVCMLNIIPAAAKPSRRPLAAPAALRKAAIRALLRGVTPAAAKSLKRVLATLAPLRRAATRAPQKTPAIPVAVKSSRRVHAIPVRLRKAATPVLRKRRAIRARPRLLRHVTRVRPKRRAILVRLRAATPVLPKRAAIRVQHRPAILATPVQPQLRST